MSARRLLLLAVVVALPLIVLAPTQGVSGELERPLTIETADAERPLFAVDLQERIVVETAARSGGATSSGGVNATDRPVDTDSTVRIGTATNAFPGQDVSVTLGAATDARDTPTVRGDTPVLVPAGTTRPVSLRVDCGDAAGDSETVELDVTATGRDVQSSATHDLAVVCRAPPSPTPAPTEPPSPTDTPATAANGDSPTATGSTTPDNTGSSAPSDTGSPTPTDAGHPTATAASAGDS